MKRIVDYPGFSLYLTKGKFKWKKKVVLTFLTKDVNLFFAAIEFDEITSVFEHLEPNVSPIFSILALNLMEIDTTCFERAASETIKDEYYDSNEIL